MLFVCSWYMSGYASTTNRTLEICYIYEYFHVIWSDDYDWMTDVYLISIVFPSSNM